MEQYDSLSLNFVSLQEIAKLLVTRALLDRSLEVELARLDMSPKAASEGKSKCRVLLQT